MTGVADFVGHLRSRLAQLDTVDGLEALAVWRRDVDEDLERFADGRWEVRDNPYAEIGAGPGRRPLQKVALGSEHVGGQLSMYTLDQVLSAGSVVTVCDLGGPVPVNLRIAVVIGYQRTQGNLVRDTRLGPPEPVVGRQLFQANVHCPACRLFATHGIYIPKGAWEGYLMRICKCRNTWRQHTGCC